MARKTPTKLHLGVLLVGPTQHLDSGPADLFAIASRQYMRASGMADWAVELGIEDFSVSWVAEESYLPKGNQDKDGSPLMPTSAAAVAISHVLAPGAAEADMPLFDVLMIPGPDRLAEPTDTVKRFIRRHRDAPGSDILTVCTGVAPAAFSGILDGKTTTGTRPFIAAWREKFPQITWDESKRWVQVDEGIWSAGGVTNGLDMVADYMRHKFDPDLARIVAVVAEVGDRSQSYPDDGSEEARMFKA